MVVKRVRYDTKGKKREQGGRKREDKCGPPVNEGRRPARKQSVKTEAVETQNVPNATTNTTSYCQWSTR